LGEVTDGVVNGVNQREDLQQQRLLPCAPAEIFRNRLDEILAPRADGIPKRA